MTPLRGFALLLLLQMCGEGLARLLSLPVPGPVIVLTRSEPVEITLVNRMSEPTAIHWHGIELDSYFDGVPGWGGEPGNLAPPVLPGQSFVAKLTPPHTGQLATSTEALSSSLINYPKYSVSVATDS